MFGTANAGATCDAQGCVVDYAPYNGGFKDVCESYGGINYPMYFTLSCSEDDALFKYHLLDFPRCWGASCTQDDVDAYEQAIEAQWGSSEGIAVLVNGLEDKAPSSFTDCVLVKRDFSSGAPSDSPSAGPQASPTTDAPVASPDGNPTPMPVTPAPVTQTPITAAPTFEPTKAGKKKKKKKKKKGKKGGEGKQAKGGKKDKNGKKGKKGKK